MRTFSNGLVMGLLLGGGLGWFASNSDAWQEAVDKFK